MASEKRSVPDEEILRDTPSSPGSSTHLGLPGEPHTTSAREQSYLEEVALES